MNEEERQRMKEAFEGYVPAYPPEKNNNRCHNCDMPFIPGQWDERYISAPGSLGETWKYTCPSCEEETIEIGT